MRFAVIASHEGTTLQAVLDACACGALDGEVCLVISNNSSAGALHRASGANVPALHISGKTHPGSEEDRAMHDALVSHKTDYVLLLGYMKRLGPKTLDTFAGRVINTHPALLPKFGGKGFFGRRVHEAVLAAGETETGATIHFVESDYDSGPVLAQVRVAVEPDDSVEALEHRVKTAEQALLIRSLNGLCRTAHAPDCSGE